MTQQELNELRKLSVYDLETIMKDQTHLYEPQEIELIQSILQEKKAIGGHQIDFVESNARDDGIDDEQENDDIDDDVDIDFDDEDDEPGLTIDHEGFMTTSAHGFEGYRIKGHLGFVSGEAVLGTGIKSEFLASLSDTFGVENRSMARKLVKAKNSAYSKMINYCVLLGANAAIGIDLKLMTLGQNMIVVNAIGTAVMVEKISE